MTKAKANLNMEDIKLLKAFFATREEIEELKERIENIPTRDELYTRLDEIIGELKAIREVNDVLAGKSSNHEDRISNLEDDMQEVKGRVASV